MSTNNLLNRDKNIDFLKFVGLSLIILAHVSPPIWIFELRVADVPMMVFASGMAYFASNVVIDDWHGYYLYFKKRVLRLLFPTWIFLGFYFIFSFYLGSTHHSYSTIISSFLLTGGIGYVWIIRVFLLIAFVAPIYFFIVKKYGSLIATILFLCVFIFLQFYILPVDQESNFFKLFEIIIIYTASYFSCFLLGYLICFGKIEVNILALIMGLLFLVFIFLEYLSGSWGWSIQDYKYPPQLLYVTYSVFVALCILKFYSKFPLFFDHGLIWFISSNTIWIYLWHIVFLNYYIEYSWIFRYFFVYIFSVFIVFIQVKLISQVLISRIFSKHSKLLKILFTG